MDRQKILFDGRWIGDHGIGRFAREISLRLKPQYILKSKRLKPSHPLDLIYLSIFNLVHRRKLFFSPGYNFPLFGLNNFILTIHDLNHIDVSFNRNFLKKLYYEYFLKRACRSAKVVFTVSEFSRNRICDWAKVPKSQVVNIGNGVSEIFHPQVDSKSPIRKYFLTVSNRRPHKNEFLTIRAFAGSKIDPEYSLVFTGDATPELLSLIESLNICDRVFFLGQVSDYELATWYRGCRALLFVSLYEGFGLPVIEAMASGVPVITSNTTSLPEIAGDAAILVDPTNIQQIINSIELLAKNDILCATMVTKGLRRAKYYSWENVVEKIKPFL